MRSQEAVSPLSGTDTFNDLVVDSIQDIKGKRIVSIDLRKVTDAPATTFILCEGESKVQVRAIADNVRRRARSEAGERANRVEGTQSAAWICIDFFDTVVHVFDRDSRDFYDLDSLWGDAPTTEYIDV